MLKSPSSRRQAVRLVHGEELRRALGFRSERSFQRARKAGRVGLKLYPMPSPSRGVHARSDELQAYLKNRHTELSGSGERAP